MKRDRGADADRAIDRHRAAGLLHKAVNLRQAESGAAADLLGREKRLENPVDLIGRNAAARIADRYRDEFSGRRSVCCPKPRPAIVRVGWSAIPGHPWHHAHWRQD